MVVAQLVEQSLPTPEVRGSNPVIGKIYMYYQLYWKDEIKEKRGRERPNFKTFHIKGSYLDKLEREYFCLIDTVHMQLGACQARIG